MTTIKETQIEALKAKIFAVIYLNTEADRNAAKNKANELVFEWIDENNIVITD